jgi:hypothetical protein
MSRRFDKVMEAAVDLHRAGASSAFVDNYVWHALRDVIQERREDAPAEVISEVPDGEGGWQVTTRADEDAANEEALWAAPLG